MSPPQSSYNHHHLHHQARYQHNAKKEILMNGSTCPPSLKIHKDSHFISKSSSSSSPPSSSSSSATSLIAGGANTLPKPPQHQQQQQPPQQQRQPVIIYTHSPKVIHTNPRDFKSLVQKLTGLSDDDMQSAANKGGNEIVEGDHQKKNKSIRGKGPFGGGTDENESSVITTDENFGSSSTLCDGQVNSGGLPFYLEAPNHHNSYRNMPLFLDNNTMEYVCPQPSFYTYNVEPSPCFNPHGIRSSFSLSTLEATNNMKPGGFGIFGEQI